MSERKIKTNLKTIKNGELKPGDNGRCITNIPIPDWVDIEKFERAKQLYTCNLLSISFGHLSGLFMAFLYADHVEPFRISEGQSRFVALLRRYISTVNHVRKWYMGDVWNSKDPAHKSLLIIRNMHKKIIKKTNQEFPNESFLYGSQFAMAMTQFAFTGLFILFPKKLGLDWDNKDMECFLHFWRCIGYLLGMDDEYNICKENYEDTLLLYKDIMEKEIKLGIKYPREESVQMAKDIITVFKCVNPLSWKALDKYWSEEFGLNSKIDLGILDWIIYWFYRVVFNFLLQFIVLRNYLNTLPITSVNKTLNNMTYYENIARELEMKLEKNKHNLVR